VTSGQLSATLPPYIKTLLQTFLTVSHISHYTTVRGLNIFRNVIVSAYVAFYQINKFFANILFSQYWQNVLALGWNGFAGRICPACRSLEILFCSYVTGEK